MDQPPEWPPEHLLVPARMKYGLLLATGQLGWEATPEVAGHLWRRLRAHMASCDLDVVNQHGCRAFCRFMYTKHGFAVPTMHDGCSHVHYRRVATELWDRLAKRHTGRPGGGRAGAISGWPSAVKATEQRAVWCELVCALPLVDEWPFWTRGEAYPTPSMGLFYDNVIRNVTPGPYLWPQATSGPKPLVSDLLPGPRAPAARWRNSLLLEAGAPRACVTVTQTRQGRFDQALMQATHGVARCLMIACQGLQEQRKELLSEDSLVAAYTLGRHFANSMRVLMQDFSELLMRCSPFSPEVPDSHPGRLHGAVRVVDNAWRDDVGLQMLQQLVEEMEEAGVRPAYNQRLSPEGHPRGDPNDSTSSAIAQGDGAAVLMARDPSSDESVNPTSSSLAQGRGPPAGAQSVDSPGGVFSPPNPPTGGVTDSVACVATQGHGTPDPMSQVYPIGESPCIASIVVPTRVLTPHSPAPPAVVDSACLTPAVSGGGVASSFQESPIPLAQKPKEPAAVDCSPCSTCNVATVKACSQSSSDFDSTLVEFMNPVHWNRAQGARSAHGLHPQVMGLP